MTERPRFPRVAWWLVALAALTAAGCSTRRLAVIASKPLFADVLTAYRSESDLELVKQAAPGHLKMLDGLLVASPDDPDLLTTACQLYTWYGFGILEDEMEEAPAGPEQERRKARVIEAYRRAREYGLKRLSLWKGGPDRPPQLSLPDAAEVTTYAKSFGQADVPALFWTSLAWMDSIQLQLSNPQAVSGLAAAKALSDAAFAADPTYYYGGPHLLLGVFWGARSKALGGDPDAAAKYFDTADQIAKNRLLLVPLLKARYWAVTAQNRQQFEFLLRRVIANDPSILPEERLANELAQRRAKRYLENADAWF